jgi:alcohol oxidase
MNPSASRRKYFSVAYYTVRKALLYSVQMVTHPQEYPVSVGRVHINSGLDAYAPLEFESGFLNESVALLPVSGLQNDPSSC